MSSEQFIEANQKLMRLHQVGHLMDCDTLEHAIQDLMMNVRLMVSSNRITTAASVQLEANRNSIYYSQMRMLAPADTPFSARPVSPPPVSRQRPQIAPGAPTRQRRQTLNPQDSPPPYK